MDEVNIYDRLDTGSRARIIELARTLVKKLSEGVAGGSYGYEPDSSSSIDYTAFQTDQYLRRVGWTDNTYPDNYEMYHKPNDGQAVSPEDGGKFIWEI